MKVGHGVAHGKVILSGEHSVVYGYSGLVAGLSLDTKAEVSYVVHGAQQSEFFKQILQLFEAKFSLNTAGLNVETGGTLPVGVGLGSSAAAAAATFRALGDYFNVQINDAQLFELVQASERFAHGNPSGMDAIAVVYGGIQKFQKKEAGLVHQPLQVASEVLPSFLLINSGAPKETTKEMVELVAGKVKSSKQAAAILSKIGELTEQFCSELEKGMFSPEILTQNHQYLKDLGVVGVAADRIVELVVSEGGTAKLTGAGGVERGSGMVLAYHPDFERLQKIAQQQNWQSYQTFLS